MEDSKKQVYELAYHIAPLVADDKVADEVGVIRRTLDDVKAEIISDENPKMTQLTYSMEKKIGTEKHSFNSVYFGWIKFETDTESAKKIDQAMKDNDHVVRHLLIKTVRENTMPVKSFNPVKAENGEEVAPITAEDEKKIAETIDELVIE